MFSYVDLVPRVVAQGALDLRGWGGSRRQGFDQYAANEYVDLDRRQSSTSIGGIDADPPP